MENIYEYFDIIDGMIYQIVIRISNIYNDYVEVLKKEYDNLDNLDIWNLWYSLDNKNIIKKEIMEKNFQIRKEGYITHYRVL